MTEPVPKTGSSNLKYYGIGIGIAVGVIIIVIAYFSFNQRMGQINNMGESIQMINVHSWVSPNTHDSVTAFAVKNSGGKTVNINSISFRGIAALQTDWYSCDPNVCGMDQNVRTELVRDYNPADKVKLASGDTEFKSGSIRLQPGQATIVYVVKAGNTQLVDAENTYTLEVTAGQAKAVEQVTVVAS